MSEQNSQQSNNTTNNDDIDENLIKEFKFIMLIAFLILLLFLGFFVYNLIKCYLPKWRGKLKAEEPVYVGNDKKNNGVQIEFANA